MSYFYREIFTSSGTFTIPAGVTEIDELLVVAGGGGGGGDNIVGGGGGGGGLVHIANVPVVAGQTYTITVGSGGIGYTSGTGETGKNSSAFGVVAHGGGGGAGDPEGPALRGGSGGGGGGALPGHDNSGGLGRGEEGNKGGDGYNSSDTSARSGGGGGGAGSTGVNATSGTGGNGGTGYQTDISGTSTYYAAGGGGATRGGTAGTGGSGIGGDGTAHGGTATDGTDETGSGGGGRDTYASGTAGYGGTGIIIFTYYSTINFCDLESNLPSLTFYSSLTNGVETLNGNERFEGLIQAQLPALTCSANYWNHSTFNQSLPSLTGFVYDDSDYIGLGTAEGTLPALSFDVSAGNVSSPDSGEAEIPILTASTDVDVQDWFTYNTTTNTDTVFLPALTKANVEDMTIGWSVYNDAESDHSLFFPALTIEVGDGIAHIHPMFLEVSLPSLSFSIVAGWNTDWLQNTDGFDLYTDSWSMDAECIVGTVGNLEYFDTLYPGELSALQGGGTDDQAADAGAALGANLPDRWTLASNCNVGDVGRLSQELPAITASGTCQVGRTGTLSRALPSFSVDSRMGATFGKDLPELGLTASGVVGVNPTLSARLPGLTISATGTTGQIATLSQGLPMLTASLASSGTVPMTLSKTLPSFVFVGRASEHTRFGDYTLSFSDW